MSRAMRSGLITLAGLSVALGLAVAGCSSSDEAKPSAPITADASDSSGVQAAEQESPTPEPKVTAFKYGQTADFGGVKMRVDKMKTRDDGYGTIYREAGVILTATKNVDLSYFDVSYQNASGQVFSLSFDTEKSTMKPGQKLVGTLYTMDEPSLNPKGGKVIVELSSEDLLASVTAEWS